MNGYTEKARRVIFYARYEASQWGESHIEVEHVLLGIFREDQPLMERYLQNSQAVLDDLRNRLEAVSYMRPKDHPAIDLPLSPGAHRVLRRAAEESERLQQGYIGTEHLLFGILNETESLASKVLREHGLQEVEFVYSAEEQQQLVLAKWATSSARAVPRPQFHQLITILVNKGVLTLDEASHLTDRQPSTRPLFQARFAALVTLLVSKGVLTEEEKRGLTEDVQSD